MHVFFYWLILIGAPQRQHLEWGFHLCARNPNHPHQIQVISTITTTLESWKPSLHIIVVCVFYWKDQNIFVLTDYTQIYSGSIPVVGCLCDMVVLLEVLMELSTLLYVPRMQ